MNEDKSRDKYSKRKKNALFVALIVLLIVLFTVVATMIIGKISVILLGIVIIANIVAFIALAVCMIEYIKIEKLKNPVKLQRELDRFGFFVAGVIVGIIFCNLH